MFFSKPASLSAWTARAHGATMSSSSGFGDPSNTRRCISEPTRQWRRLAPRSPVIFASIIPADHIRALTGRRQIRPISTGCRRSRRPEPGRHSTYQTGKTAQTNRASSQRSKRRFTRVREHYENWQQNHPAEYPEEYLGHLYNRVAGPNAPQWTWVVEYVSAVIASAGTPPS